MDNSASIRGHCPGGSNLSGLLHLALLGPEEEHVALLAESDRFGLFQRLDDFFAEGVAGVFGLAEEQAKPLALCFHAQRFTPTEAVNWLVERSIRPLLFIPIVEMLETSSLNGTTIMADQMLGNQEKVLSNRGKLGDDQAKAEILAMRLKRHRARVGPALALGSGHGAMERVAHPARELPAERQRR